MRFPVCETASGGPAGVNRAGWQGRRRNERILSLQIIVGGIKLRNGTDSGGVFDLTGRERDPTPALLAGGVSLCAPRTTTISPASRQAATNPHLRPRRSLPPPFPRRSSRP